MYKSAFQLICDLADNPEIENIIILKKNSFSVKFFDEEKRLKFQIESIVMFLEILEAKEENSKKNKHKNSMKK